MTSKPEAPPYSSEQSPSQPVPAKRSWRLRWSLRVLLVFIGLVAIGLGWISYQMRMGHLHEEVAEKLAERGWSVSWKLTQRQAVPTYASPSAATSQMAYVDVKRAPDWMVAIGAEPLFQRIKNVYFHKNARGKFDDFLREIERLDDIEGVSLDGIAVSEDQLEVLLDRFNLETLAVFESSIGRRPMPFLRDSQLKWLGFSRTHLSDNVLDNLPDSLEYLDATRTRITDEGLQKLVRLKNLKELRLRRTPTSQAAIEDLKKKMPWCQIFWAPL
ncbi:hypothetical protein [Blastopirellula marina]|uniref:Leucine-rich repeat domain-containing protein n=1 Tax=Blastopirellula marina TaxID=124 RepID=A0A2S8F4M5_9BACT|nr:hypothetical protein [Blastopirellula marina]PQO27077.1 hypothetical protein C5Y98_27885 [Blastopirellula marina]PTL41224.1 hypothetical protein C5Y97_27900 [Blastopirellula marina]